MWATKGSHSATADGLSNLGQWARATKCSHCAWECMPEGPSNMGHQGLSPLPVMGISGRSESESGAQGHQGLSLLPTVGA